MPNRSALPALPSHIRFGREICGDLTAAERREWWLSNGRGAYAAGTVAGSLTRRYHGLLIAPVEPPLGRRVLLAKADPILVWNGHEIPLHTNRWGGGTVHPEGYVHIESFELDGRFPVWQFAIGSVRLEMRIWMEPGQNTTYLAYKLLEGPSEELKLKIPLLINARDHHGLTNRETITPRLDVEEGRMAVHYSPTSALYFGTFGGVFRARWDWYENFALSVEQERGLPDRDEHLCVGELTLQLRSGQWTGLVASTDMDPSPYLEEAMRRAQMRERMLLRQAELQHSEFMKAPVWVRQLILAADSFIFERQIDATTRGVSVIAGYPWFGDWGRDTMIALPGLTLACGRIGEARSILETFARYIDQGMLPNVFPGNGDVPEYNTVDAALWYVDAWRAYMDSVDDQAALEQVFPVLEDIMRHHVQGTRYRIKMDSEDGLLYAGEAGVQLTWMDAKVGEWVVTPRIGKPVEINALWYNALKIMEAFAKRLKKKTALDYGALAKRAGEGFARFKGAQNGGLYDVIDGPDGHDATLRPNQIFAVSLPHIPPLDAEVKAQVVDVVGRKLLTSYGLRSLEPDHNDYRAHYVGGVLERDGSYHQGPVWAWLLGHYAVAHYHVHGDAEQAQSLLQPLQDHLFDAGLGTVSEIFDGDAPHTPRGAPVQAWSVACALDAWLTLERAKAPVSKK